MKKRYSILFTTIFISALCGTAIAQTINTIAGTNIAGFSGDGGTAAVARLFYPTSVTLDAAGNLYISDAANRRIRKINSSGIMTTVVGSGCGFSCYGYAGDGLPATSALLYYPNSVILDTFGNMFIADYGNYRIRKVNTSGIISTYAGNGLSSGSSVDGVPATATNINFGNLALDGAGNIYFGTGYSIRKVNTAGIISTYVGLGTLGFSGDGGPASAAQLNGNGNVAADAAGNLYINDNANYRIRKVNTSGIITTIAGNGTPGYAGDNGPATTASITPFYISLDKAGEVFITDHVNNCVRKIDTNGIITTIAGTGTAGFSGDGGPATLAKLYQPGGVAVDNAGSIYIADGTNNRIRKITYGNHPPHLTNGHSQTFTVCANSVYDSVNALLAATDSDMLQTLGWSQVTAPLHGTLAATYNVSSSGGNTIPAGLFYTPAAGYSGNDSFKVKVTDGLAADSTVIHITVSPAPGIIEGSAFTCVGLTTVLTDTIGAGTWVSGNTAIAAIDPATGVVTGTGAGIVTITYSPVTGCLNTRQVTINAVPTVITGPAGLCVISSISLYDSVPGGNWTSSNSAVATINTATGSVSGIAPGVVTITYSILPGCAASRLVSVYALPAAITGATHICQGSSTTLSDASAGGAWFSSNSAVASVDLGSGIAGGLSYGNTIISYAVTVAGVTCSATTLFNVDSLPSSISGILHACPGASAILSDNGSGIWASSSPAYAIIGTSSGIVSGIAAGNTNITYTLPSGCITSAIFTVDPLPAPITGVSGICIGTSTLLAAAGGGAWSSSNPGIAGISSSGTFTGVSTGYAVITYTLPTGCYTTMPVTVSALPVSVAGPSSVCTGSVISLTDATSGGFWSGGPSAIIAVGSSSGVVSGLSGGIGTVTYTSAAGCIKTAGVTVNVLPSIFSVTGGGSYCAGGTGLHVVLNGSSTGIVYRLFIAGAAGPSLAGNGGALDFGLQTAPGIYTIVATNTTSGCSRTMAGSAVILINPLPAAIGGPAAVCIGATVAETDTGGGTWISSNPAIAAIGSATGALSGIAFGNAVITYTLPGGCMVSKTVTVSSTPTTITGASSVCSGATAALTDSAGGGTWISGNPAIITVSTSTGIISGISAGNAIITYTLGTGCTRTKTVTVNPAPPAISGSTGICTGHAITLSDSTAGGTWTSSATAIATAAATGVITGIAAGTADITYTLPATGCFSKVTITVNTTPSAITGAFRVCSGQTTTLGDATTGGSWSAASGGIADIGSSSGIVTGRAPGVTLITYSFGSGCLITSSVTVNAAPSAIIDTPSAILCQSYHITFTDTTTGGIWSSSSAGIASVSAAGMVTGINAGIALISYTVAACTVTRPVTVNALPMPVVGPVTVCAGLLEPYTEATPGGTWVSSGTAIATVGLLSGLLSGITSGVTTLSYILPTGCSAIKEVTVNPVPPAISGGHTLCVGSVITLTDSTAGGTWRLGAGSSTISLTSAGVVRGISLGTALVSYTTGGCSTVTSLTVNSLPPGISGPTHVCSGSSAILTDSSAGGTWASATPSVISVGSATGVVTGISAGTGSIVYTLSPGCTAAATVSVIALPSAISGPAFVCAGASVILTDTASGGVWSSSDTTIDAAGPAGVITGRAGGVATISYTTATGCAATHAVTSVTVAPITIIHNLCAWGDTMHISDAITSGIYTSTLASVVNLGGGSGIVTSNGPGLATVRYMLPSGCITHAAFTVNPLPAVIAGPTDVCATDSVTLSDATPGGFWSSSPGIITVGSSSGIVSGISGGAAYVTYTLSATGCRADTLITVTPQPVSGIISGPGSCCMGNSIILTDTATGGAWASGGIVTSMSGGLVRSLSSGTDTISYTVTNRCGTSVAHKIFTVNPLPDAGTITGTDSMCVGNSVLLASASAGGTWTATNAMATVSSGGVVTGVSAGIDTVIYTVNNAWCSAASRLPVKIISITECASLQARAVIAGSDLWTVTPNPAAEGIHVSSTVPGTLVLYNMQAGKLAVYPIKDGENSLELPALISAGVYFLEFDSMTGGRSEKRLVIVK